MIFDKIKGHTGVLSKISREIKEGLFEGVYLFKGPLAVGKYTVARTIGKYLTCTGLEDDTCRCENCRLFPSVPDYLEISKESSMIVVDDVEPLESFVSLKAYRGKSRVIVIDNAHNLNHISANKLLKLLEEIPPHCVIILVTDSPERLLPTIVSRCCHVSFQSLSSEDIREVLKGVGHDSAQIAEMDRMIPYFSESVIRNFNRYSEYVKYIPRFLKDMNTIKEDDLISTLKEIDSRDDISIFIEVFQIYINDLLKIRYDSPDVVSSVRNIDNLEPLTSVWKEDVCVYVLDRIRDVRADLKKRINLKPGQMFIPTMLWCYYFLNKK